MYQQRIDRILAEMKKQNLSQLLVSDPDTLFFLTGSYNAPFERFWGLLISEDENVLFANKLFHLNPVECKLVIYDDVDPIAKIVASFLKDGKLGVDGTMAARFLLKFLEEKKTLVPVLAQNCIDAVRSCKDEEEREFMRISSKINDEVMAKVPGFIHEKATEIEIAELIKKAYQKEGANGLSFGTIVCFGKNAADPHHKPDNTVLEEGNCILVDMGCKYKGYCSDMTRTFYWKKISEEDKKIYEITLNANLLAEKAVKSGKAFCEIDLAARDYISSFGYGENFFHRLGHGIGLTDHEGDDVSSINKHLISPGMCFSIEPGIYIKDKTGVRIEDLVLVTEEGPEILNQYTKELQIL